MPKKTTFSQKQLELIWDAAERVFNKNFLGSKKAQVNFALAIGLSQQTVSKLLKRDPSYRPGPKYVLEIAVLDGKSSIEQLVGEYQKEPKRAPKQAALKNLETCIAFHDATKHWSPWTLAAARSGFFGTVDFPAPEWSVKLDQLEKHLEKGRRVA